MLIFFAIVSVTIVVIITRAIKEHESEAAQNVNLDSYDYKLNTSIKTDYNTESTHKYSNSNDIEGSYAFANRLKNLIFSRRIDEDKMISEIGITKNDLKKYKFSKGLPPENIIKTFERYFNVDFTYLADYHNEELTIYENGKVLYKIYANYPRKARFDEYGNCIFVDYVQNEQQEYLVHYSYSGYRIGSIGGLHCTEFLKISSDGKFALAVSEIGYATLIDLNSHNIIKKDFIGIGSTGAMNVNVKDLVDNMIEMRFTRNETIAFSLDFNFQPINVIELFKYHAITKDAPRYLSGNYYTLLNWIVRFLPEQNEQLQAMTDLILIPTNKKYFSKNKLAKSFRAIGEKYQELNEIKLAIYYFEKALEFNEKVGVKAKLNKLKNNQD